MALKDKEMTSFNTSWGTFYYKVMPFGLKILCEYQRVMTALFDDMIHKDIEVYVDEMIAKSMTEEGHTMI